jgi:hypothetical protein
VDPDLLELHAEVDGQAARLARVHRDRLQCRRGCASCCVDDLTVFEVEANRIRVAHAGLLAEGRPHPPGACAFLDGEGACRVYDDRPYVCRTLGLPLRWWSETGDRGEWVEHRDICPLNVQGPAIEALADDVCWLLGPYEDRLRRIQTRLDDGAGRRVSLRSLFSNPS